MDEALLIFKQISNSVYFKRSSLILFLNKVDLLEENLRGGMSPIHRYDRRYTANPTDIEAGKKYFADRFKRLYRETEKQLYIHFTNATDAHLLDVTMQSVQDTILRNRFDELIL
jgi:guanine nucleotide-binding protein subunit alpha